MSDDDEIKIMNEENFGSANDFMYVFAQLDENNNGKRDDKEDIHVFWIDLKNPNIRGKQY